MREWLDFIHPSYGLLEARYIRNSSVHQTYMSDAGRLAIDLAERDKAGWDCYVGVLPRKRTSGRAEDVWPTSTVLWADVDAKDFCPDPVLHDPESKLQGDPDDDKARALDAVLKFPVTPSAIVDSGHGFHLYWRLFEPVDTSEAVEANRAIAKWLGADKCFDAPRILRVPGTHNHKDPENPIPVRVLKLDTLRRYYLSDFTEMVESLYREVQPRHVTRERREDAPDWLKDLINAEPAKGTRSEEEFRAALWLARYGYTDEEILDALMNLPFGSKAQERGERWARQEVARIRRKA